MITSIIVHRCPHCNSEDICRNGHDYKGAQKYHCHRCKSWPGHCMPGKAIVRKRKS